MSRDELINELGELAENALAEYPEVAGLLFTIGAHLKLNKERELSEMLNRARPGILRGIRDVDRLHARGEM